ncbi:MAG TPA: PHP domain-containing protein [Anaerolineaceae bacterium]|nr:PHP domain-containing protein [Anaerolineaceae bacterium]
MRKFRAEFHIHTVLSPCADVEMIPPLIVQEALERGINLIAITDHNASANVAAVQTAAAGTGLAVLPGMELQTREEVHVLCLFDTLDQIFSWQQTVDARLPSLENQPEHFGEQFVVDETGDFIRHEPRLLLTSAIISLEEAFDGVSRLGGLCIPAHVDRRANGLIANLGFIPTDIPFPAMEISRHLQSATATQKFPQLRGYPLIQSGDVHRLSEFLGVNELFIEEPCIEEIYLALANQKSRQFHLRTG